MGNGGDPSLNFRINRVGGCLDDRSGINSVRLLQIRAQLSGQRILPPVWLHSAREHLLRIQQLPQVFRIGLYTLIIL